MYATTCQGRDVPLTGQGLHVDDISLRSLHECPTTCIANLKALATTLAYHISQNLKVPIAEKKMYAAANSSGLLKDLKETLGPLSGKCTWAPGNLGVPFTTGRHRMVPMARAIKLKRVKKFFHRLAKLGTLK
eukprot:2514591-Pyramimonas_sp.AAC.1